MVTQPRADFAKEELPPSWCNQMALRFQEAVVNLAAGDVDLTSSDDAFCGTLRLVGALTANRNVIVPADAGWTWLIVNETTGAFSATVKTSGGTGIAPAQTKSAFVRADGANVKRASADV